MSTVCPPPWFCPPAPRNPELPAHLTQLLTGHRTRTPHGGSEEIWILKLSTRNHVVFWCCRLTGKTGKFGGLWEPFTSGTESQSSLRSQFVKRWRCRSLRTPLLSAESRCINPRLSTRTRRRAENRTHLETARWRDFFSSSTEGFRVVCFELYSVSNETKWNKLEAHDVFELLSVEVVSCRFVSNRKLFFKETNIHEV